jgi:tRNA(Arg) A34 adenosine deaminase TadA
VVNWRPCAMCYGAVIWSGIRSLAIAGSGPDLEQITGFDEGPVPADWAGELQRRGIEVIDGLLRNEARRVFEAFRAGGNFVYNGRQG